MALIAVNAMARSIVVLLGLQLLQLHGRAALGQVVISVNRTAGQVEVASCEGLKKNAELGIDIDIIVTANLRCSETVTIPSGVDVTIGSEEDAQENWYIVIAEDFAVPDPTSATLLVNPKGSYLSLDRLSFSNDPGTAGSPGAVRAVRNEGTLDVSSCLFSGLNFASAQDGGAVRARDRDGEKGRAAAGGVCRQFNTSPFVLLLIQMMCCWCGAAIVHPSMSSPAQQQWQQA